MQKFTTADFDALALRAAERYDRYYDFSVLFPFMSEEGIAKLYAQIPVKTKGLNTFRAFLPYLNAAQLHDFLKHILQTKQRLPEAYREILNMRPDLVEPAVEFLLSEAGMSDYYNDSVRLRKQREKWEAAQKVFIESGSLDALIPYLPDLSPHILFAWLDESNAD